MPRFVKLLLGVAALVPLVLTGYLLVRVIAAAFDVGRRGGVVQERWLQHLFDEVFAVQLVALALTLLLLSGCLWHLLVRNARRKGAPAAIWMVALMVLPIVSIPIYWLLEIWPEGSPKRPGARPA